MLVKKMNTTVGNVEEGIYEPPATYLQVHQCFEYEQKRPFLFSDMQMGSDILNFLLVDHRVSCTQSFD